MTPVGIAPVFALGWRRRHGRVALEPGRNIVVIKLLRPNHAGERLALDRTRVGIGHFVLNGSVEFVGFLEALRKNGIEIRKVGQASSLSLFFSRTLRQWFI